MAEYRDEIKHIKAHKAMAEAKDKPELSASLEHLFNEIAIIESHIGKTPQ